MNVANISPGYWESYKAAIWSGDCSLKSLAAKASCIVLPIFLVLATIFTFLDSFSDARLIPKGVIEVTLQGARQYDLDGDKPAACTFHAVEAMRMIATDFDQVAGQIADRDKAALSHYQKGVIQRGLNNYELACHKKPDLVQGADLKHMREFIPEGIHLGDSMDGALGYLSEADDPISPMIDHLKTAGKVKVIWVKNGNEESFALIGKGERVIIFDSHYNKICLLEIDQMRKTLKGKLFLDESYNSIEYALGTAD